MTNAQSCTGRGLHGALRYRSAGELLPPLSILAEMICGLFLLHFPWSRPGVQSLVLPLTFYRFAVAGSGSLETFLCPGLSQHIGTGTCLVLVHAEVALGALHHMKGLGTRGALVFQGLPALRPGMGKD